MKKSIIDESKFNKHHQEQVQSRSQKDIFFIWMLVILIAVIGAHFALNTAGGSPTGFVTASQSPATNTMLLLETLLVAFVSIIIVALIHIVITRKDH